MSTITTAQAASTAGVTGATIRTWCRRGVIAATKAGGRWSIEAASLARRIQIGQYRTATAASFDDHPDRAEITATLEAVMTLPHPQWDPEWDLDHPDRAEILAALEAGVTPTAIEEIVGTRGIRFGTRAMSRRELSALEARTNRAASKAAPRRGWSKYSGGRHGLAHREIGALTGLSSSARDGECHFCGLDERTCDCV